MGNPTIFFRSFDTNPENQLQLKNPIIIAIKYKVVFNISFIVSIYRPNNYVLNNIEYMFDELVICPKYFSSKTFLMV